MAFLHGTKKRSSIDTGGSRVPAISQAMCNFLDDKALFMNWHDSLFVQSFRAVDPNQVILRMEHPASEGEYEVVMEVIFTRK